MRLRRIRLQDFRNIAAATLEFESDRCFLLGANAQGKTNLLEAIGFVSALRAFRPGDNRTLIRTGAAEAAIACVFDHETLGSAEVLIRIRARGKEVALDGTPVRTLSELIGRFPTVLFASEDIQLVRGAPALRRRFLDLHLASLDPKYLTDLQHYHRALENRNQLLKDAPHDTHALTAFEQQVAPAAARLVSRRREGLARLGVLVGELYGALSGGDETGSAVYRPDHDAMESDAFLQMLERHRARDAQLGSTQHGPHRDDLELRVADRDATLYGSEGQQRALVLALRFAQLRDTRARGGVAPVVLADDVLGELDPVRRARFWDVLDRDVQLFATGTTPPSSNSSESAWTIFDVAAGAFSPAPEKIA